MIRLASKVVVHSTCIDRVQSLPWPTAVVISKQIDYFNKTRLQTFLKLVAVSSMHMLQDVRCLDEEPMHFGVSIHLQLGGARRKSGETTSPQTKHNSSKCSKTLLIWYQFTSKN